MVTPSPGGTIRIDYNRAFTDVTDGNGQPLKFEENKDSPGDFKAKGTDGNEYAFSTKNVVVEIGGTAAIDTKALRRRMPGIPLPKDEAKKLDDEIKKEDEERKKLAQQGTSPEAESMKKRAYVGDEIGPRVVVPEEQTKKGNDKDKDTRKLKS